MAAAFESVTAWGQTVLSNSRRGELMNLAVKHATVERNVTHLIFPDNVQTIPAGEAKASGPEERVGRLEITPAAESVEESLKLLRTAKRPVIIIGRGARDEMGPIIEMVVIIGAPVITTFKAKGHISDDHELACGVLGRSGTPVASWPMNEADLLLVLGASLSNHTCIYAGHPTIQVDFDPLQLGKVHPVTVPVWGDIGTTCRLFMEEPKGAALEPSATNLWSEHFDVAVELGSEASGQRAAYGGSPGDADHAEPYVYVGPWEQEQSGPPWNATTFGGVEILYSDLVAAENQVAIATDLFEACLGELTT